MAKKPRESLVMGAKKKKTTKKKTTKKKTTKKKTTKKKTTRKPKPLIFGTELPADTLPAREDERPEYSP